MSICYCKKLKAKNIVIDRGTSYGNAKVKDKSGSAFKSFKSKDAISSD